MDPRSAWKFMRRMSSSPRPAPSCLLGERLDKFRLSAGNPRIMKRTIQSTEITGGIMRMLRFAAALAALCLLQPASALTLKELQDRGYVRMGFSNETPFSY